MTLSLDLLEKGGHDSYSEVRAHTLNLTVHTTFGKNERVRVMPAWRREKHPYDDFGVGTQSCSLSGSQFRELPDKLRQKQAKNITSPDSTLRSPRLVPSSRL